MSLLLKLNCGADKFRSSSSRDTRATAVDRLVLRSICVAKLSASVRISSKEAFWRLPDSDSLSEESESDMSESSTTGVTFPLAARREVRGSGEGDLGATKQSW